MVLDTPVARALGIDHAIIQAGMSGGVTTPDLVAAVSEAGGLGTLAGALLSPSALGQAIEDVRAHTSRAFAVNLFVPRSESPASDAAVDAWRARLAPFVPEGPMGRGRPGGSPAGPAPPSFRDQVGIILDSRVPVVSFTFGVPPADSLEIFRREGIRVLASATTVDEARALEAAGVDAIVAQGSEAGGHRATFDAEWRHALVGTMALVPQVVDAVRIPVIAAGGIMDGRGVAAALCLGAQGAQLGTAFLAAAESGAAAAYKARVLAADETATTITRAFTGKPARAIRNRFTEALTEPDAEVPPFPVAAALAMPLLQAAIARDDASTMPLYAGQGTRMATADGAADIVARIVEHVESRLGRMRTASAPIA